MGIMIGVFPGMHCSVKMLHIARLCVLVFKLFFFVWILPFFDRPPREQEVFLHQEYYVKYQRQQRQTQLRRIRDDPRWVMLDEDRRYDELCEGEDGSSQVLRSSSAR